MSDGERVLFGFSDAPHAIGCALSIQEELGDNPANHKPCRTAPRTSGNSRIYNLSLRSVPEFEIPLPKRLVQ